ncbi:hypothetical protein KUTeg_020672 [Tegillarca granosa]|uniref:Uncharacterized protein n=1 Tax=Tegillarca granosa TaxID=220873 RepID=A0ABQ9E948_TEGGR|nr:hypothetical protein KUTeg_020672 [Tegillarca granosa]
MVTTMGKSRAEIQRSYRERQKLKEGKKYLEKESERVKKYYKPPTELTPQALKKRRARIRKCMERRRKEMNEKEKRNHDSMELVIENSVLPQINLEDESGPCDSTTPSTSRENCLLLSSIKETSIRKSRKAFERKQLSQKVLTFFEREDNSSCLQGKRDTKKYEDGTKQVRVLNDYMYNLHLKFKSENPEDKIGLSTFSSYRPKYIKLVHFSSRKTCLCQRHQNMALKVKALNSVGIITTYHPDTLIKQHSDVEILRKIRDYTGNNIKYSEWKRKDVEQKVPKTECDEANEELMKMSPKPVKGTMEVHSVFRLGNGKIAVRNVSWYCQNCFSNGHFHPTRQGWTVHNLVSDDNFNESVKPVIENHTAKYAINSYVAAIYNAKWYIGKILEYNSKDNEYNISFMRENVSKVRYRYKWSSHPAVKYAILRFDCVAQKKKAGNSYTSARPILKPWYQIDLQEFHEVHAVVVHRYKYQPETSLNSVVTLILDFCCNMVPVLVCVWCDVCVWFPINFRAVGTYVSKDPWDFINTGAIRCDDIRYPRKAFVFRFQCKRPLIGQFVTIRNFDFTDELQNRYFYLSFREFIVLGKPTMCGRPLGMITGDIRDFQLESSTKSIDYLPELGTLYRIGNGWCANNNDPEPWFMVKIHSLNSKSGWTDNKEIRFIKSFTVSYGMNLSTLEEYKEISDGIKVKHFMFFYDNL